VNSNHKEKGTRIKSILTALYTSWEHTNEDGQTEADVQNDCERFEQFLYSFRVWEMSMLDESLEDKV